MLLTDTPRLALVHILGKLGAKDRARCSVVCRLLRDICRECPADPDEPWERMAAVLDRVEAAMMRRRWEEVDAVLEGAQCGRRDTTSEWCYVNLQFAHHGYRIKTCYVHPRQWWRPNRLRAASVTMWGPVQGSYLGFQLYKPQAASITMMGPVQGSYHYRAYVNDASVETVAGMLALLHKHHPRVRDMPDNSFIEVAQVCVHTFECLAVFKPHELPAFL